jgi:hypothetical protein
MQASEPGDAKVQQSRKLGGLRKSSGLSGFAGLAKVLRQAWQPVGW